MSINWLILAPADQDLRIPTYGNYGGPDYAGGKLLEPGDIPSFTVRPSDPLDALFRKHDKAIPAAPNSLAEAKADLALIKGILALPKDAVSGEGDLYAGAAILSMIGRIIVTNRHPEVLARIDLPKVIDKAVSLIEQGSIAPDPQEVAALAAWLQQAADALAEEGHEPIIALAVDRLQELADSLSGPNTRPLRFDLGDDVFTFPAGEAKALLVQAAEAAAETWEADHHDAPVVQSQLVEALSHKLGLHTDHGDFLL